MWFDFIFILALCSFRTLSQYIFQQLNSVINFIQKCKFSLRKNLLYAPVDKLLKFANNFFHFFNLHFIFVLGHFKGWDFVAEEGSKYECRRLADSFLSNDNEALLFASFINGENLTCNHVGGEKNKRLEFFRGFTVFCITKPCLIIN